MRSVFHVGLFLMAWAALSGAVAQVVPNPPGTTEFTFLERRVGGRLEGCEIAFRQFHFDTIYRNNGLVMISGGFAVWQFLGKAVAPSIRISPHDVNVSASQEMRFDSFDPTLVYAILPDLSNGSGFFTTLGLDVSKFKCEYGGYCAAFSDPRIILGLNLNQSMRFAYQRRVGGSDVQFKVDIPRPDQSEWKNKILFNQCVIDILENAR